MTSKATMRQQKIDSLMDELFYMEHHNKINKKRICEIKFMVALLILNLTLCYSKYFTTIRARTQSDAHTQELHDILNMID